MNKALMIPIQPQHAINILNGKKTLELRTWIPKGYVGWVYVYVTKGKPYLVYQDGYRGGRYFDHEWQLLYGYSHENALRTFGYGEEGGVVNGLVVFRFWFDEYEEITLDDDLEICTNERTHETLLKQSCVDYNHLNNYFMNENGDVFGYAWHIKQLEVFDEPKSLSEFYSPKIFEHLNAYVNTDIFRITKAPQKMVYVYVNE